MRLEDLQRIALESSAALSELEKTFGAAEEQTPIHPERQTALHPFEVRNVHPDLPSKIRRQFDDGYYADAAFTAFKFVEHEVKRVSKLRRLTGHGLMMKAFDENDPVLALNAGATDSDRDEQLGYRFIFAGAQSAIRNPRGHEVDLPDDPDLCLDHLAIASVLLRKLDAAGLR